MLNTSEQGALKADTLLDWVEPQIESHTARDLTQSGGLNSTDFGGIGNDCS